MKLIAMLSLGAALGVLLINVSQADAPTAATGAPEAAKLPPAATQQGVTFVADIKPIFEKSCVRCHAAGQAKARLRLDSLEGVLKGSEVGKVVKPGDSTSSRLVYNVAHVGKAKQMPPPRNKANIQPLTSDQVGLIRAWIDQGAK
jgi:uncharacterized membrane protein